MLQNETLQHIVQEDEIQFKIILLIAAFYDVDILLKNYESLIFLVFFFLAFFFNINLNKPVYSKLYKKCTIKNEIVFYFDQLVLSKVYFGLAQLLSRNG